MRNIHIKRQGYIGLKITQNFYYYTTDRIARSGAYAMHTNSSEPTLISANATVSIIRGKLVQEIRQEFTPWLSQVIRLYHNNNEYIEFDWMVGPIPPYPDMEIISRFETKLETKNHFFTDSNGRQTLERKLDFRPTWNLKAEENVARNYYPITSWLFIKDSENFQISLIPDRTQGGTSLKDGSIELMIHRRLSNDDGYGMDEALNELGFDGRGLVARGKHLLLLDDSEDRMNKMKRVRKELYWKPFPIFATVSKPCSEKPFVGISHELGDSIHLLSLEELSENNILIRFEFFYEINETKSKSIDISLKEIFTNFQVIDAIETSLSGIEPIAEVQAGKLEWNCTQCHNKAKMKGHSGGNSHKFNITLYPNEIKTFLLKINRKK